MISKGKWKFNHRMAEVNIPSGDFKVLVGCVECYDENGYVGDICTLQSGENVGRVLQDEAMENGKAISTVPEFIRIISKLSKTGPWETSKLESLITQAKDLMEFLGEIKINKTQKEMMMHAIGRVKRSDGLRNHYCSGDKDPEWEALVAAGYAKRMDRGPELGGIYYFVTEEGYEAINMNG